MGCSHGHGAQARLRVHREGTELLQRQGRDRATRVRVNNVVYLHKQGKTADEIRVEYPDLTHAQIYAALAYYHDHKDEIEAELAEDEGADERYEQRKAKALAERHGR